MKPKNMEAMVLKFVSQEAYEALCREFNGHFFDFDPNEKCEYIDWAKKAENNKNFTKWTVMEEGRIAG